MSDDGMIYFSQIGEPSWERAATATGPRTPNGQRITRLFSGKRLLIYTRSRVYYLRRNKLRLWRLL